MINNSYFKNDYTNELKWVQVELSSLCNALCLGCVRTSSTGNSLIDTLDSSIINKDTILELICSRAFDRVEKLEFCGTVDEPFAYPEFYELLKEILSVRKSLRVYIHTNGSLRDPSYFKKVGNLIGSANKLSTIRFSVDGLENTNQIYRQKTNFKLIMDNMKAVCTTEAQVIWQYIVFPWNKHQIKEAEQLAIEIGCTEFWVRPDRSSASVNYLKKNNLDKIESELKNKKISNQNNEIECSYNMRNGIFISNEAKVWPCCYIANLRYLKKDKFEALENYLSKNYGDNFNNLNYFNLDKVLSSDYFRNDLMLSWDSKAEKSELNSRCIEKCSSKAIRSSDNKKDDRKDFIHLKL
jgi:MoaA/NifB/PqqE/SkfB family radical SAM enzyme